MHQLISYITFLLKSTNQHGVHSPFVYDFVTKCLYNKTNYQEYKKLKKFQKLLLNSKNKIVLKKANYSFKKTKVLYKISDYFNFKNTLVLGSVAGLNSYALTIKNKKNKTTVIEESEAVSEFIKDKLLELKLSNVTITHSTIKEAIQNLNDTSFDAVIFNNTTDIEAISTTFNTLITKAHNNSVFMFNAIHASKQMTEIWNIIISNSKVSVSIDCFSMGFIFFRKEQPKQHFTIRL